MYNKLLHKKVSSFTNTLDKVPKTVYLDKVLMECENLQPKVKKLRSLQNEDDQKKYKTNSLPCFTTGGECSGGKEKANIVSYSGLLCIDVDHHDNLHLIDFKDFKTWVSKIEYVTYCAVSSRGKGYFLLIPISHPERYSEHFLSLERDFARCGVVIDPNCKNLNRLRFISYDPKPFNNPDAKTYDLIIDSKVVKKENKCVSKEFGLTSKEIDRVEALIAEIEDRVEDITGGYHQWFRIGCALANEFGEAGREYFHRVSQYSGLYEYDTTDKQFTVCLKRPKSASPIHINTLFHYAKQYGIILNGPEIDFADVLFN